MVPARFVCTGDIPKARTFIGLGRKVLIAFAESLKYNRIKAAKAGPYYFEGGIVSVSCRVNFIIAEVRIHYKTKEEIEKGKELVSEKQPELKKDCLCFPHFAMAVIRKVYPETLSKTARYKYDIGICNRSYYLLLEGAYDANFGRYSVGQVVLATVGAEMSEWDVPLDCDRKCLVDKPRFTTIMLSPIMALGRMTEWRYF